MENRKMKIRPIASMLAVGVFMGALGLTLGASASDVSHPTLIEGSTKPANAPPAGISMLENDWAGVGMSGDASTKFTTTGIGGQIMVYDADGSVITTALQPTNECPSNRGITSGPYVSYDGKTIAFQSTSDHIACLAGQPGNGGKITSWVGKYENRQWTLSPVYYETSAVATLPWPSLNGDGSEIYFSTADNLNGEPDLAGIHVYKKNLQTQAVSRISLTEKTGTSKALGGINPMGTQGISRIVSSIDGRFVGWTIDEAANTGRMLSDEAGDGMYNLIVAEIRSAQGVELSTADVRMTALPSPDSSGIQSSRKGTLLALVSSSNNEPKAFYTRASDSQAFSYNFANGELYDMRIKLSAVSNDGMGGAYAARYQANWIQITGYNLGQTPGESAITSKTFGTNREVFGAPAPRISVFATKDRATLSMIGRWGTELYAKRTQEIPLP